MTEVQTLDQLHIHVTDAFGDRDDVANIERAVGRSGKSVQFTVDAKMLHRSFWRRIKQIPHSEKSVSVTMRENRLLYRVNLFL
jgi:predicted oxidoreductase